jgi:hypothetical protein
MKHRYHLSRRVGYCDYCTDEKPKKKEIIVLTEDFLTRYFCQDCLTNKFLRPFLSNKTK